jgi:hypothetical protein
MRRFTTSSRLWALVLGAAWLAVGPFAGVLQGLAQCRHHDMTAHHSAPTHSTDAPCFCDHMTDTGTATVTPPVAMPETVTHLIPGVALVAMSDSSPVSRLSSHKSPPTPPPPIPLV